MITHYQFKKPPKSPLSGGLLRVFVIELVLQDLRSALINPYDNGI